MNRKRKPKSTWQTLVYIPLKVDLSLDSELTLLDPNFFVSGAQQVITMLNKRQAPAKQLILNHNTLGNEGTNILFRFLESPAGRTHPIGEITLNSNGIGNKGLLSIARYLKDNRDLKELFVQAVSYISPGLSIVSWFETTEQLYGRPIGH